MYLALGAAAAGVASSALDLLSSLAPSKSGSGKTTGVTQPNPVFDIKNATTASVSAPSASSIGSKSGALSPGTFNALLAAQDAGQPAKPASRTDALKDLFAQIDSNGDGKITKTEFENKLGAGGTNTAAADNVFSKLDTDGDGTVSLNELSAALIGKGNKKRHAHGAGGGQDALLKALEGAQSSSTTKSDGSTSTTLTYANGTTVTLSTPAASSASASASSSYNLVERMIQKQVDALAASSQQSVSVKV